MEPVTATRGDAVPPNELVGSAVQRAEDPHLISGDAEYTDDVRYPGEAHLAVLRSQYGHAEIGGIDAADAEAVEGVVGVVTAEDVAASGVPGTLRTDDPDDGVAPPRPILAGEKVTYQGQAVAAVIAEDRYVAHEAAGLIDVDYERLDAVVDPAAAIEPDAPTLHDEAPDNRAFEWSAGDAEATEAALEAADRVVEVDLEINRVVPTAMEPRAAVARHDGDRLEMEISSQNPHAMRTDVAASLGLEESEVHVRSPDVGGGFGAKLQPYAGYVLAAWAAMEYDRPVKWVATRTEDFQSMVHSRHHLVDARVGVDDDGTIRGLALETVAPVGGALHPGGANVPTNLGVMANGQYALPAVHVHTTGAFTNTAPLSAYRGAGRPEATYVIERVARAVAAELDVDPVELRRRNFVRPEQFPYETGLGRSYDSGDYEGTLDVALDHVGYEAFRERQARAREDGRYLGVGLSCYVEACGAAPGWGEVGGVEVAPDGSVTVVAGTAEIGTGHRTSYAQIVAGELGVPLADVEVVEGDTDRTDTGGGTAGSRAIPVAGSAVRESATAVRERAREVAAERFEAAIEDVAFEDGRFAVRGVPERSLTIAEVAEIAASESDASNGGEAGLAETTHFDPPNYTFPFGTHVAIVEVDPASGEVAIERYVAVDDVGTQINPKLVEGQIHGGVVQGIGQALYEGATYDDNGTLVTGSLQDYAVPKAEHVPEIEWDSTVTECPHNPLGAKGVGEAGAIAAPPAVVNAVLDALEPLGVESIDMPLTPETVWRAIDDGA